MPGRRRRDSAPFLSGWFVEKLRDAAMI
jgi:hypothetical protein